MNKTRWAMVIAAVAMFVLWIGLIVPSSQGYGYPGYGGYHGGHSSFFFWGSSRPYYHSPSARSGSVGGPKAASRGGRGGK